MSTVKRTVWQVNRFLVASNYEVTAKSLNDFILPYYEKNFRHAYINGIICCARAFTNFLKDTRQEYDGKIFDIKFSKRQEVCKSIFSEEEIKAFFSIEPIPYEQKKIFYRDEMLFRTLCETGCRPAEACKLKVDDVDLGRKMLIFRETKTLNDREVPIPPTLLPFLEKYLQGVKDNHYLFEGTRTGEPLNRTNWARSFQKRLDRIGIKRKGLTPYSFRHTLATDMVNSDINIFKIQRQLGHKKLETTSQYVHMGDAKQMHDTITRLPRIRKYTDPVLIVQRLVEVIKTFSLESDKRFEYSLTEETDGLTLKVKVLTKKD